MTAISTCKMIFLKKIDQESIERKQKSTEKIMQLNEERIKITKDIKERKYNSIIKLREEQNQYLDKIRTETNEEMKIKEQKRKEEIEKFQKWIKDSNDQKERKNDLFKRKKVDDNVFFKKQYFCG